MRDTWRKIADIYLEVKQDIREEYKKEDQSVIFDETFKSGKRFSEGTPEKIGTNYNS